MMILELGRATDNRNMSKKDKLMAIKIMVIMMVKGISISIVII